MRGAVKTTVRPPVQRRGTGPRKSQGTSAAGSFDVIIVGDVQSNRLVPLSSDSYRLMSG